MGNRNQLPLRQSPSSQLAMPNPLFPNPQLPITNYQLPITYTYVSDVKTSAATAHFQAQVTICGGKSGQLSDSATITRMPDDAFISAIAPVSATSDRRLVC